MPGAFHGFDQIGAGTLIGKSFNAMKLDALRCVTGVHQERNL
jgi:hypothetical protein